MYTRITRLTSPAPNDRSPEDRVSTSSERLECAIHAYTSQPTWEVFTFPASLFQSCWECGKIHQRIWLSASSFQAIEYSIFEGPTTRWIMCEHPNWRRIKMWTGPDILGNSGVGVTNPIISILSRPPGIARGCWGWRLDVGGWRLYVDVLRMLIQTLKLKLSLRFRLDSYSQGVLGRKPVGSFYMQLITIPFSM